MCFKYRKKTYELIFSIIICIFFLDIFLCFKSVSFLFLVMENRRKSLASYSENQEWSGIEWLNFEISMTFSRDYLSNNGNGKTLILFFYASFAKLKKNLFHYNKVQTTKNRNKLNHILKQTDKEGNWKFSQF